MHSPDTISFNLFLNNQALLETHDAIKGILGADQLSPTSGEFGKFPYDPYSSIEWEMPADISAVRVVGLRKNPGEPLVS